MIFIYTNIVGELRCLFLLKIFICFEGEVVVIVVVVVVVVKLNPHGPIMSIGGVIYSIYIVSR